MPFLPFAILAYAFNAGSTIIDKILLTQSLKSPFVYVFYVSIAGLLVIFLIPFGVSFEAKPALLAAISGIISNFALLTYFASLKKGEASVVAPVVGALNPFFSLVLGLIFLNQLISGNQLVAFLLLLLGSLILTYNIWSKKIELNRQLILMVLSGLFFAISYVLLRESFLDSNFISGLTISRLAGGILVLGFLLFPNLKREIFTSKLSKNHFSNSTSVLLFTGQAMGASSGLLITYAISLTSPALVNSLFGVQYLVILAAAFIFKQHNSKLLEEDLTKGALVQKFIGVILLSIGVYLLSK